MSLISIANSFLCENRAENGNKVTSAKENSLSFFYTIIENELKRLTFIGQNIEKYQTNSEGLSLNCSTNLHVFSSCTCVF